MARITIGNIGSKDQPGINGFVNFVSEDKKRFVVGTGSYTDKDGNKVYKESISVFVDDKFNGQVPAKGDYVGLSGDLTISERKDKAGELQATMNVRFGNQVVKLEAPKAKEAAPATEGGDI